MAFLKKENCARTTINQVGGIDSSTTSLTIDDASDFPASGDFLVTIWDKNNFPDPCDDVNNEIVKVTNVIGNIFTIVRGQDDTLGVAHGNSQAVELLITKKHFDEITDEINALSPGENVFNEDLTSQVDGIETEFTTVNNYQTNTLRVYLNGIRQRKGASFDYTETSSNTFEFNTAPKSTNLLIVDYIKS